LEVEVLEIVAWPFALHLLGEDLIVPVALTSTVNLGQVLEEEPGAPQEARERTIVIRREGVDTCLDVGEVLPEEAAMSSKRRPRSGQGRSGARRRAGAVLILLTGRLSEAAQDRAMAHIPSDARKLGGGISSARGQTCRRFRHALHPIAVVLS
jgi:hypothetical protein